MAYTVTPGAGAEVVGNTVLTKTIDGTAWGLSLVKKYDAEGSSWRGELDSAERDKIADSNDAWDPTFGTTATGGDLAADDLPDHGTAGDFPTGFLPATYSSLTKTLGDNTQWSLFSHRVAPSDDGDAPTAELDDETMDGLKSTYESLGVAGLENAGWTAGTEDYVVQGVVTLTDV